jgi:DnaJ-class molecular chaperone
MIGKYLELDDRLSANQKYKILRDLSEKNLIKLKKCEMCGGTGLQGVRKLSGNNGYTWDGRYCELCDGTGFVPKYHENILFVCRNCKGTGCKICDYKGIVDWITYLRGE